MAVSFSQIPSNLRIPFFFAEFDNSAANTSTGGILRSLLVGQRLSAGTVTAKTLVRLLSADQAGVYFGVGSMLHAMAIAYFANDANGPVYAIAVDDKSDGTKSTNTLTVTAAPTANGTIPLYIGGTLVPVEVLSTDDAAGVAVKIDAAVNAALGLPVTSADASNVVTLTARHKGVIAGQIDVRFAYLGVDGGEALPAGLAITLGGTAGTGDPIDTVDALTALADEEFEFVVMGHASATVAGVFATWLAARWAYDSMLYGHAFGYVDGVVGDLDALGDLNDPHLTIFGASNLPDLNWAISAAAAAQIAVSVRADPARPTHTLPLVGIKAPARADRFSKASRNSLLHEGCAQLEVVGTTVQICRAITTYVENAFGSPDNSYLDSETLFTLAAVIRRLRIALSSKYGRHKLVNDGTRIGSGQAAVSPATIRAELIATYSQIEDVGLVENAERFAENLIVERNVSDPNRVDILYPPDLANQLRVLALLAQFRLQYAAA